MKFKTFFASMALLMSTATLVSCSDDKDSKGNDDAPAVPAAKELVGTYEGDMTSTVMGSESTFEDMTFAVTATDDVTASITIPTFGNPPMQVPEITITGIKVSGEDGTYTLAPTEFSGVTESGKNYSGTTKGSFANGTLDVQFSLQYGAMPMPMICSFSAVKE